VLALVDEGLDRVLAPGERAAVDAHLAGCAECRAGAAAAAEVHGALEAMEVPDPGPALTEAVVAALDRGPPALPAEPPVRRAARIAASLLATAAVAAAAVLVLPESASAAGLDGLLPAGLGASLPAIPEETGDLLRGAGSLPPPCAAAASACAAAVLLTLEVAAARRRNGGAR
jgi:anti-sigma factor RsiW